MHASSLDSPPRFSDPSKILWRCAKRMVEIKMSRAELDMQVALAKGDLVEAIDIALTVLRRYDPVMSARDIKLLEDFIGG